MKPILIPGKETDQNHGEAVAGWAKEIGSKWMSMIWRLDWCRYPDAPFMLVACIPPLAGSVPC